LIFRISPVAALIENSLYDLKKRSLVDFELGSGRVIPRTGTKVSVESSISGWKTAVR
jgi:hypothetical protein